MSFGTIIKGISSYTQHNPIEICTKADHLVQILYKCIYKFQNNKDQLVKKMHLHKWATITLYQVNQWSTRLSFMCMKSKFEKISE